MLVDRRDRRIPNSSSPSSFRALGLLYSALFLAFGAHLPYWPAWLAAQGLGPGAIGNLLAAGFLARVLLLPVISAYAERHGDVRPALRAMAGSALVAFVALLFVPRLADAGGAMVALIALSIGSSLLLLPLTPLTDGLAVDVARTGAVDYARLRLIGSLSFIVANLAVGRLVVGLGPGAVLLWLIGMMVLVTAAGWLLPVPPSARPRPPTAAAAAGRSRPHWLATIPAVLGRRHLLAVLVAAACVQASHAMYYSLGTVHWQHQGLAADRIGALWAFAVSSEVVLFARADWLTRRLAPTSLVALGAVAAIVRWTVTAFDPPTAVLWGIQLLHAFTFAATHLGAMGTIAAEAPPGATATTQGIYSALSSGLVLGLATLATGASYGAFGGRVYLLMSLLGALGLFAVVSASRSHRPVLPPEPGRGYASPGA